MAKPDEMSKSQFFVLFLIFDMLFLFRASKQLDDNLAVTTSWKEFVEMLDNNKVRYYINCVVPPVIL